MRYFFGRRIATGSVLWLIGFAVRGVNFVGPTFVKKSIILSAYNIKPGKASGDYGIHPEFLKNNVKIYESMPSRVAYSLNWKATAPQYSRLLTFSNLVNSTKGMKTTALFR